jgi:hypothetical protein
MRSARQASPNAQSPFGVNSIEGNEYVKTLPPPARGS